MRIYNMAFARRMFFIDHHREKPCSGYVTSVPYGSGDLVLEK